MRSIGWAFAVALLVVAGCSSSGGSSGSRQASRGGAVGAAGAGTVGGKTTTSGFGNSNAPVPVAKAPTASDGGQLLGDGSACEVGKFCPPNGPDQGCGKIMLESTVKMTFMPGNVLIIFDRSTSMTQDWNGTSKWAAAGTAVLSAIMPLADKLTIGAILFPAAPDGMCAVHPITAADQIPFQPGLSALKAFQAPGPGGLPSPLYGVLPQPTICQTPTSEAIQMADMALTAAAPTLKGTTLAILLTDGEPNCSWDQNQAVTTLTNWLNQRKIKTYVVGLPGSQMGNGTAVLTTLAQAGGTMQFYTPADAMTLQMKLHDIVIQTVSMGFNTCAMDLMPPTGAPDKLQLVVEQAGMPGMPQDVPHDLGMAGGWTISPDGSHVEITGKLCDGVKSGQFSKLTFQFGCNDIPPLPPNQVH